MRKYRGGLDPRTSERDKLHLETRKSWEVENEALSKINAVWKQRLRCNCAKLQENSRKQCNVFPNQAFA